MQIEALQHAFEDRFTIDRTIGWGGMATVYLARERHPPRQVAIKVLLPELSDRISRERFLREIDIVSQLTHPHIVPVFTAGEAAGMLYYVMPYIPGESLRRRIIRYRTLPLDAAVRIAGAVADALAYAHSVGIVHRDIKPENILFEADHAVVTDFGIARAVSAAGPEHLTEVGIPIGTPAYMSPEQASAGGEIDARTDIYSLGCVLYEMLTGRPPVFPNALDRRGPPTGLPAPLHSMLQKALAWDPADRYQSAAEFSHHLTQAAGTCGCDSGGAGPSPSFVGAERSIAVLPFANLSDEPTNIHFTDGLTDEIIAQLSQIQDLSVTSRTSVMRFKETDQALREIGQQLGVTTILEGCVRRAGDRVRITAQLNDVEADVHVWADTYERDLTDVFRVQREVASEIAKGVVRKLTQAVGTGSSTDQQNEASYDLGSKR